MKPTIHLIAPFHTVPAARYSHCAFTGKALRFAKMMTRVGYRVIEYSNSGSESLASEHVEILSSKIFKVCYPPLKATESIARDAIIGSQGWTAFDTTLRSALSMRVQQDDIIAHPFGRAHAGLLGMFPQAIHVETGVGYEDDPFNAWRIFESEAWRHYHWGREDKTFTGNNSLNRCYSWVIPNYFDLDDWPVSETPITNPAPYLLFMNRIHECKGLLTMGSIIRAWEERHPGDGLKFMFAGQGDFNVLAQSLGEELTKVRTVYLGSLEGRQRARVVGGALAMMMPTNFVEPFGGAGVEGMLTGTPLLASDWGAFTETVKNGENGYRCKTLEDWIDAIERLHLPVDRKKIAEEARAKYSLEVCGAMYDRAFTQLGKLYKGKGWYELRSWEELTTDPGPKGDL